MARISKYTQNQKDEAIKLYKDGLSLAECGKKIGIPYGNIRDWCIENGNLRSPKEGRKLQYLRGVGIGENHYRWQGGRNKTIAGYMMLHIGNGFKNRAEHILVAEKALKRRLKKGEIIHHINGDKLDNRNVNLIVCDRSYHQCLHNKMSNLYMQEHFANKNKGN